MSLAPLHSTLTGRNEESLLALAAGEGNARDCGCNLPRCFHRALEAARHLRLAAGAIAMANRQLEDTQTGARRAHLHLEIPAIGSLLHLQRLQGVATDGA